jgi:hypothetical protein
MSSKFLALDDDQYIDLCKTIIKWSKTRPTFNDHVFHGIIDYYESPDYKGEYRELTDNQKQAIENVIRTFRIQTDVKIVEKKKVNRDDDAEDKLTRELIALGVPVYRRHLS